MLFTSPSTAYKVEGPVESVTQNQMLVSVVSPICYILLSLFLKNTEISLYAVMLIKIMSAGLSLAVSNFNLMFVHLWDAIIT